MDNRKLARKGAGASYGFDGNAWRHRRREKLPDRGISVDLKRPARQPGRGRTGLPSRLFWQLSKTNRRQDKRRRQFSYSM
jgi:hypothetical protein